MASDAELNLGINAAPLNQERVPVFFPKSFPVLFPFGPRGDPTALENTNTPALAEAGEHFQKLGFIVDGMWRFPFGEY